MILNTPKVKKCQRVINGKRCNNEATWRYRHDIANCIIYRCDEHMERDYKLTATISI
jgi:hypothetical protein